RMAEGVAPGLRPDGKTVRFLADRDARDVTGRRVDHIDDVVVPAGGPRRLAVGADVAHVGPAATRDGPRGDDFPGGEVDAADAPLAVRRAADPRRAAVGGVEPGTVAARV